MNFELFDSNRKRHLFEAKIISPLVTSNMDDETCLELRNDGPTDSRDSPELIEDQSKIYPCR